jgi:uncharacterized protein YdiU (UPF0061 family)
MSHEWVSADLHQASSRPIGVFSNSYAEMPDRFFARLSPTRVEAPRVVAFNRALAEELGLDIEAIEALGPAAIFSGNLVPPGADPIAMAYAGHQFGQFTPQLGDGRAILMGEVVDRRGRRRDIQWKGSGPTPFSRRGDGRAALGPALREYLVSEAMHALGIPTTRGLAVATTGEFVYREQRLPGAVFTRVAASHVRIGTFQYFAARRDDEGVKRLADHAIDRHYPQAGAAARPYLALLEGVVDRQASLIAKWMNVGFIHGVMNTDNMSISGETIDFGPCAFMDAYDPGTVFSSIDETGRYAYANQPRIAAWNLARLAETLLPLIDGDLDRAVELATAAVQGFSPRFEDYWLAGLRAKIGLGTAWEGDADLARGLLLAMQAGRADFTLTFRRLGEALEKGRELGEVRALFSDPAAFDAWSARWRARLDEEPEDDATRAAEMRRVNPAVIPRNHNVEAVLAAAAAGDFGPFEEMSKVLATPYEDAPGHGDPPPDDGRVYMTFCGT